MLKLNLESQKLLKRELWAKSAVQFKTKILSVSQLTKYLEQIYGPKNIYQLEGKLGSIYQKNEEHVVTYTNRVKILGKQILKAHKDSRNVLSNQDIKLH